MRLTNTLERWYRHSLIMGDELDDLRAVVSEQGLAFRYLQQAAADAEERQKSSHVELLEMMVSLLKNDREGGAQQKSSGQRKLSAVDTAGRDTVSPSLGLSNDGTGSQEERDVAEADPTGGKLGDRGQGCRDAPLGEPSITARDILRGRSFLGQPKTTVPALKGRENFDSSKQMRVYAKLHGFESVFDSGSCPLQCGLQLAETLSTTLLAQTLPFCCC